MDNNVSKDKDLLEYPTLDKMLEAEFYPGNYNPTQDQAKQLIKAASLSAIRWAELHKNKSEQSEVEKQLLQDMSKEELISMVQDYQETFNGVESCINEMRRVLYNFV